MRTIKIKKATKTGLKKAEGELIEAHGFQFCFTKVSEGLYFLIELSSGCNVIALEADYYCKREAREIMKQQLEKRTTDEFRKAIKKFIKVSKDRYNIQFPVNEPV